MKKSIVLTHKDLDGAICAIVLRKAFPNIEVVACTYKTVNEKFAEAIKGDYKHIFITDISLDEKRFEDVIKDKRLHFIDHHPRTEMSDIANQTFSIKYAGCTLTVVHLRNKLKKDLTDDFKVMELVKFGNDYDLWNHKYQVSKFLNRLYYYLGFDTFVSRFKKGFQGFTDDEKKFLVKNHYFLKDIFENLDFIKINDFTLVLITDNNIDESADYLLKTNPGIDTIFIYNTGIRSLSMRGKYNGIHFGDFLTEFGGGGHKVAAAVALDEASEMERVIQAYTTKREELMNIL